MCMYAVSVYINARNKQKTRTKAGKSVPPQYIYRSCRNPYHSGRKYKNRLDFKMMTKWSLYLRPERYTFPSEFLAFASVLPSFLPSSFRPATKTLINSTIYEYEQQRQERRRTGLYRITLLVCARPSVRPSVHACVPYKPLAVNTTRETHICIYIYILLVTQKWPSL